MASPVPPSTVPYGGVRWPHIVYAWRVRVVATFIGLSAPFVLRRMLLDAKPLDMMAAFPESTKDDAMVSGWRSFAMRRGMRLRCLVA